MPLNISINKECLTAPYTKYTQKERQAAPYSKRYKKGACQRRILKIILLDEKERPPALYTKMHYPKRKSA